MDGTFLSFTARHARVKKSQKVTNRQRFGLRISESTLLQHSRTRVRDSRACLLCCTTRTRRGRAAPMMAVDPKIGGGGAGGGGTRGSDGSSDDGRHRFRR